MYQKQGRAREPCSEVLSSDCFKMPKIVSTCPLAYHASSEIVSKCPKLFQNAQNLSYGYWIIITTQLLSALRALLTIWIVLLNVLPHQSWFVIRDVNLTYHNYSWQQLVGVVSCCLDTTGPDGAWGPDHDPLLWQPMLAWRTFFQFNFFCITVKHHMFGPQLSLYRESPTLRQKSDIFL